MIVDKVLGARAVNLSHADRYSAGAPSRQHHMDAHGSCACVWCCSYTVEASPEYTAMHFIPKHRDGCACQIAARKIYIFAKCILSAAHLTGL